MTNNVVGFDTLGRHDTAVAGGKGANLGELTGAGLPVPPGFVISADAYLASMERGGTRDDLRSTLDAALLAVDSPEGHRLVDTDHHRTRRTGHRGSPPPGRNTFDGRRRGVRATPSSVPDARVRWSPRAGVS